MTIYEGVVRNKQIVLPEGIDLPESAAVEVHLLEKPLCREEAFARLEANRIYRNVGMDEIIEEEKRELEERSDQWLSS